MNKKTINKIKPYITTISELIRKKKHGEEVIVGGEITDIYPPTNIDKDMNIPGLCLVDDSIGITSITVLEEIWERDKDQIYSGNIVLIKGIVDHLNRTYNGEKTSTEYKVMATSIIPIKLVEESIKRER